MSRGTTQPVLAGLVAAVVGFASTFAVVLAGLRAVGADDAQAASGLLALTAGMGVATIVLSVRHRMPLSVAWSTPGAALLVASGSAGGGFSAAVGAFVVAGALVVLAGLWTPLGRALAAIPPALASAMLAGVLLPVCLAPVRAVAELPVLAGVVVAAWALLVRFARPWAVPGALAATAVVVVLDGAATGIGSASLAPVLRLTAPTFEAGAIIGIGLPLFVVTMASQNVPGVTVMASFGYRAPLRPALTGTGLASVLTAPFGAHSICLAAITAALMAGPDAHPDPGRRWIASVSSGVAYLVLAATAGVVTAAAAASPPELVATVAGLALLGALAGALRAALESDAHREAAVITFVVSASAITVAGISAPFWGLVAGLAFLGVQRAGRAPAGDGAGAPVALGRRPAG
jgi:benzoate membrane transport protein